MLNINVVENEQYEDIFLETLCFLRNFFGCFESLNHTDKDCNVFFEITKPGKPDKRANDKIKLLKLDHDKKILSMKIPLKDAGICIEVKTSIPFPCLSMRLEEELKFEIEKFNLKDGKKEREICEKCLSLYSSYPSGLTRENIKKMAKEMKISEQGLKLSLIYPAIKFRMLDTGGMKRPTKYHWTNKIKEKVKPKSVTKTSNFKEGSFEELSEDELLQKQYDIEEQMKQIEEQKKNLDNELEGLGNLIKKIETIMGFKDEARMLLNKFPNLSLEEAVKIMTATK